MKIRSILFSVVLAVGITQQGYSQLNKGSFLIGGTLSANATTVDRGSRQPSGPVTNYTFNVSPNVSYFVKDRLAVGLVTPLNYTYNESTGMSGLPEKTITYSIGPAVRYYFPAGSWAFFPTASFAFGRTRTKYGDGNRYSFEGIIKGKKDTFTAGVGAAYFLTKNVSLEAVFSYVHNSLSSENAAEPLTKSEWTDTQFNLSVGVQVYLFKKE